MGLIRDTKILNNLESNDKQTLTLKGIFILFNSHFKLDEVLLKNRKPCTTLC